MRSTAVKRSPRFAMMSVNLDNSDEQSFSASRQVNITSEVNFYSFSLTFVNNRFRLAV
ncbi:hypothetical protein H6G93_38125, partial [Nostoc sp. FACHB-973]|nr:hypothetical protein [Nostoc sp. FACHB-973]